LQILPGVIDGMLMDCGGKIMASNIRTPNAEKLGAHLIRKRHQLHWALGSCHRDVVLESRKPRPLFPEVLPFFAWKFENAKPGCRMSFAGSEKVWTNSLGDLGGEASLQ
jgi:hypothetical protein